MKKIFFIVAFLLNAVLVSGQQIGNYVNNGSFEDYIVLFGPYKLPLFWSSLDTNKYCGELLTPPDKVPFCSYTYQWPYHANNHYITSPYSDFGYNNRGYPRNRLKGLLKAGTKYCAKMYVNLSDQSTHGIDQLGMYFGDGFLDTITNCTNPITYLIPQVKNPNHNVISDTMNWVLVSGQFTANGTEKYLLIGNFKTNANTDTTLSNSTNLPTNAADYLIDAVSCIEVNLPAYAGRDTTITPGTPVYLGRERDFAIDPGCEWYQWPNMNAPIYDKSGLWVNPVVTTTYIVKQTLDCSSTKWDTIVVTVDPTITGVSSSGVENDIFLFPNPANDFLELTFRQNSRLGIENEKLKEQFYEVTIYNSLGQMAREEEIKTRIDVRDLPEGVYFLRLVNHFSTPLKATSTINTRFVIAR